MIQFITVRDRNLIFQQESFEFASGKVRFSANPHNIIELFGNCARSPNHPARTFDSESSFVRNTQHDAQYKMLPETSLSNIHLAVIKPVPASIATDVGSQRVREHRRKNKFRRFRLFLLEQIVCLILL